MSPRLKRRGVTVLGIIGALVIMLVCFVLGVSYSVSEWAPVKANHEMNYIKLLASADQRSPDIKWLYELHNRELDVQLMAYRGTLYARSVFRGINYLVGKSDDEKTLDSFIREAAAYRRDNPFIGAGYGPFLKQNLRESVAEILAQ